MPLFNRITIIGPGLLGASLAMASKQNDICSKIRVWARRADALQDCERQTWCDETMNDLKSAVVDSDLTVVCTPIGNIEETLRQIVPFGSSLITDVGSVKESICKTGRLLSNSSSATFIGSHPMAGSEKSGMENANSKLFENRTCIITPHPSDSMADIEKIERFWEDLGMKVFKESAVEHDKIVAAVSHLPHLVASSLSDYLSKCPDEWLQMSGQGLLDTTRVAMGNGDLWCEIMRSNQSNLIRSLDSWIVSVEKSRELIQNEDWSKLRKFLSDAADCRAQI